MIATEETKVCPFCAETIKAAANVCKHCGRDQPQAPQRRIFNDAPPPSRVSATDSTTGGQTLLRLFVVLVVVPVGALLFAMLGGAAAFIAMVVLVIDGVFGYFLPVYEAKLRKHPSLTGVVLLNIFLGWTLIGWVAALVWAVSSQRRP